MSMDIFTFIHELERRKTYYHIASYREDYLMFLVSVPGERWEVEFAKNGDIEVEIFRSDGQIFSESVLEKLLNQFA